MSNDTDTSFTKRPICPHCGHMIDDPSDDLDFGEDEGLEVLCDGCERFYWCTQHVRVTYSTTKAKEQPHA